MFSLTSTEQDQKTKIKIEAFQLLQTRSNAFQGEEKW